MIAITTYQGVNGVSFGTEESAIVMALGKPESRLIDREGDIELHYSKCIARFGGKPLRFREFTLLPGCEASINGTLLVWEPALLKTIQELDPDLVEALGFVVSLKLGLAFSGFHDGDLSQMAIHAFPEGDWNCFSEKMKPFSVSGLGARGGR